MDIIMKCTHCMFNCYGTKAYSLGCAGFVFSKKEFLETIRVLTGILVPTGRQN